MRFFILIVLFSIFFFFVGNNIVDLTNPDEVFYVQTAKEMAARHSWNVPYLFDKPQFEKPILTYWLLRAGFLLLGDNNFSARFFPALFALIGVLAVYGMAVVGYRDRRKAFYCSVLLMSSALYIGLARTVFTDMIFSVFILLSLASFYLAYERPLMKSPGMVACFIFSALAVLTKGPLGFLLPFAVIAIFLFFRRDIKFLAQPATLTGLVLFCLASFPWYIIMIREYGQEFVQEFFYNDHWRRLIEAEHRSNDTFYFYPLSMLGCMFPWTFFVGAAFMSSFRSLFQRRVIPSFDQFILIWICVVFLVFQSAHSKLVSYVLPLFPAMALLAGAYLYDRMVSGAGTVKNLFFMTMVLCGIIPLALLVGIGKYPVYLPPAVHVYGVFSLFLLLLMVLFFMIRMNRFREAFFLISVKLIIFLFIAFGYYRYYADYVSSRTVALYLVTNYEVRAPVICSKMFLRGVRLYSGKEVAFINARGSHLFSPHPVPVLNSDDKVRDFLKEHPQAWAVVNRTYYRELLLAASYLGFKCELIKVIADAYLLKISHS
jgi:4-amino-4-deoxy-L-arabinose transferase-like glycosyltransferase